MTTRRDILASLSAGSLALTSGLHRAAAQPAAREPDAHINLWPGDAPGDLGLPRTARTIDRSSDPALRDRAISGISVPRLAVFRPARPGGGAVLIMPGGGYQRVVLDREGYEAAIWAREHGITAFVLAYRLPAEGWRSPANVALSDGQRAMRVVQSLANQYGFAPARVGTMGFSAGGHLCADLAARWDVTTYIPVDSRDALSARPFCAAPIYPVVSMDPAIAHPGSRSRLLGASPDPQQERALSPDTAVRTDAPPHFLVHAEDDRVVPVANTLRLRQSLRDRGVSADTHLFAAGGHGFGLGRRAPGNAASWPDLWLRWFTGLERELAAD